MNVKNTTTGNISINKSVQIDVNTMDVNDGYVLPSQVLDLTKSMSSLDLMESEQLKDAIYSGGLIFVIDGYVFLSISAELRPELCRYPSYK